MKFTGLATFILATSATLASAQPLPAPPMAKYVAPVAPACAAQTLNVYFPTGDTTLTHASAEVLAKTQRTLQGCVIGPVSIQASAADASNPTEYQSLTQARLATVRSALDQFDLAGPAVEANVAPTSASAQPYVPMARKVEIKLSAWSPEIG